jgi:hypothetical protein
MKSLARKLSLGKKKDDKQQSPSPQASSRKASSTPAQDPIPENTPVQQSANTTTAADEKMSDLPKTYKAAILVGQQKPLEIKEVPLEQPKEGEVLLKVLACGVCHSDHHVLNGDMGPP